MASVNAPTDLTADSRTVPYGVGYDLERDVSKHQWLALAVDLLRVELGEAVPVGELRAAVAERLDTLHTAGVISRALPRRYARS